MRDLRQGGFTVGELIDPVIDATEIRRAVQDQLVQFDHAPFGGGFDLQFAALRLADDVAQAVVLVADGLPQRIAQRIGPGRLLRQVHTLAMAYGWREIDILSMSALRRQVYLEMLGE